MKHVVVCGDLVWDTHIARLQFDPRGYFQPHGQTQLATRHGGAWYLSDAIGLSLRAAGVEARVDEPERLSHAVIEEDGPNSGGIAKGFSVWEWFESTQKTATAKVDAKGGIGYKWRNGPAEPGSWRIKEFLGCQEARWTPELAFPPLPPCRQQPDLLVIDDLGLGFSRQQRSWPDCLTDPSLTPKQILVKATPGFDLPLWQTLLEPGCASRLTVVTSAAALRDYGAHLTRGLSWDRSIQEIKTVFTPGGKGASLRYCQRVVVLFGTSGAAVFSREPRSPFEEEHPPETLRYERFVYDPAHLEETWSADAEGISFGKASLMTAALAPLLLRDRPPSSHAAVSRGLAAARALHREGAGRDVKKFHVARDAAEVFTLDAHLPPEKTYQSAFPRELLDPNELAAPSDIPALEQQTLLTDALGLTAPFLTVAAQDIVRYGRDQPLHAVPFLSCGKYYTVDREEIEALNAVRHLILDYQKNRSDNRPLSIAVFGPPGSGKSFAIKQLSVALFGKDQAILEFNLSQFSGLEDLHEAFHCVRDKSVQGRMPFVFWDEFDSARNQTSLGWLIEFLAPMQDAHFVAKGREHPFGKCVFIFAGGTCRNFEEFSSPLELCDDSETPENAGQDRVEKSHCFREVKGPDFISRLRGYVNIKGPNPLRKSGDEVHLIRRALLLRSLIEKHHPDLLHPGTKELPISTAVLNAFLGVKRYRHGARSMEAIVSLSRLHRRRHFGPSELPSRELVELHVTPDFTAFVETSRRYHLTTDDIETLARMKHENWRKDKSLQGYEYGPIRDDSSTPKRHPLMIDYAELTPEQKEANRLPARLTALRLEALGYSICAADQVAEQEVANIEETALEKLSKSEHRRWMRINLLQGRAYGNRTDDTLLRHVDLCPYENLEDLHKHLDIGIISTIFEFLLTRNLALIQLPPPPSATPPSGPAEIP